MYIVVGAIYYISEGCYCSLKRPDLLAEKVIDLWIHSQDLIRPSKTPAKMHDAS